MSQHFGGVDNGWHGLLWKSGALYQVEDVVTGGSGLSESFEAPPSPALHCLHCLCHGRWLSGLHPLATLTATTVAAGIIVATAGDEVAVAAAATPD